MGEAGSPERAARAHRLADHERQLANDERSGAAAERRRAAETLKASQEEEGPD